MLKKSITEFNTNPFTDFNDKWAILIAGDNKTGYNGMTVSWGTVGILWGKPVAFVFVRHSRFTFEFAEKSENLTLSFLDEKYRDALKLFGSKSGRDINKFEATGLHAAYQPDTQSYMVAEASSCLNMKKLHSLELPYEDLPEDIKKKFYPTKDAHKIYICEIKEYLVKEE